MDLSVDDVAALNVDGLSPTEARDARGRFAAFSPGVHPESSRVLEIGPLDRPVFRRPAFNVQYADHADSEQLRRKYDGDPNVRRIVDVDVVWDGTRALADVSAEGEFDCVVASHVIEHIPNPVGWLLNIATALRPGGVVCLVVPDKRFSFDRNRRLTETSDLVAAYVTQPTLPSGAQLYDFHTKAIPVVASEAWAGRADYAGQVRAENLPEQALQACRDLYSTGAFVDVHCHTFTPASFVDIFTDVSQLGILPFHLLELVPTERDSIEFYVRLEYRPDADRATRQATDFTAVLAEADQIAQPAVVGGARGGAVRDGEAYVISERERRVIERKRRLLNTVRGWAAGVRRRLKR